ncbi:DUF1854 domain-containing protein, partial [bacterium]|nr:DUF1854 domain-containing protein [bacterium]
VVDNDTAYPNIFFLLTFPVHLPDKLISVCSTDEEGRDEEIGIIEDIKIFSEEAQKIVKSSLKRHYFQQTITRVFEIKLEYGLLFLKVETTNGRQDLSMHWRRGKALEYGQNGKVLLDTFENRYIIPNLDDLPTKDYNRLVRYIYW